MKIIDCTKYDNIEYASWGDIHIGNNATSMPIIRKFIKWVQAKRNRYFSLVGDLIEGKDISNPHYDVDVHSGKFDGRAEHEQAEKSMLQNQVDEVVKVFKPIANRCIFISPGNHERNRSIKNRWDVIRDIGARLGVATGTYANILQFKDFRIYEWHGHGVTNPMAGDHAQMQTNRKIYVKRKLRRLAGDCKVMIMHHMHQVIIHPPTIINELLTGADGVRQMVYRQPGQITYSNGMIMIPEDDRWYCASGSALLGYVDGMSSYAEEKGYPPTETGFVMVKVRKGDVADVGPVYL